MSNFGLYFILGGIFGCLVSSQIIDKIGREYSFILFNIIDISLIVSTLKLNLEIFYLQRFLLGAIASSFTFLGPIMLSEKIPIKF